MVMKSSRTSIEAGFREAAASPEQDDATPEETPAEEPAEDDHSASAWTDEQLLGAGWTQEQIDAMRNG